MKRKRDIQACFLCEKSGNGINCDGGRPCSRCITSGTPHMCIGGSRTALGSGSYVAPKEKKPEVQRTTGRVQTQSTTTVPPRPATSSSATYPSTSNGHTHMGNVSSSVHQKKENMNPEEDANSQEYINKYLIQQLNNMKLAQDKLTEEINELKSQNLQLSNDLLLLRTAQSRSDDLPLQLHNNLEAPMVIYDLTQTPPKVLTANSMFCQMLGYSMNEVIGAIWTKFIHHDYLEKTVSCFLQNMDSNSGKNKPIILEQCYKDSNGSYVLTKDTYIILYNSGTPRSVFVNVIPKQYNAKLQKNSRPQIRIRNIQPKPSSPTPSNPFSFSGNVNGGISSNGHFPTSMKSGSELMSPPSSPGFMFNGSGNDHVFNRLNFNPLSHHDGSIQVDDPSSFFNNNLVYDNNNNNNGSGNDITPNMNIGGGNIYGSNTSLSISPPNFRNYFPFYDDTFKLDEHGQRIKDYSPSSSPSHPPSPSSPEGKPPFIDIPPKNGEYGNNNNNNNNNHLDDVIQNDEIWKELSSSEYWLDDEDKTFNDNMQFDFQYDQ